MSGNNDSKQLRNYVLTVYPTPTISPKYASPVILVSPQPNVMPNLYTLEFDIIKDVSNTGSATFRVYNLSSKTRNLLLRDDINTQGPQIIEFRAGYGLGTSFPIVFRGLVSSCTSSREGVNIITTINCFNWDTQSEASQYDGDAISGDINTAIDQVTTNFITNAQGQMLAFGNTNVSTPTLSTGLLGNFTFTDSLQTQQVYAGNSVDILNQITGNSGAPSLCYIDDGKLNVLSRNMFFINPTFPQVSATVGGLLGAPNRQDRHITLDMLFEPRVRLSQQLTVNSTVNPYLNNKTYKVAKIAHKGIISPVTSGEAVTTLDFYVLDSSAPDYQQVTPF
jgi:hypothetical protein